MQNESKEFSEKKKTSVIGDKLDFLFEKQRSLINEEFLTDKNQNGISNKQETELKTKSFKETTTSSSSSSSSSSNPDFLTVEGVRAREEGGGGEGGEGGGAETRKTGQVENKMKRLYEIKEPFSGYRIFMIASALLHETIELQRETNWKWWKKNKELDNEKLQEEIIDIWHFLIQLSIEAGLDSEKLISKYIEKNKENSDRQLHGY